MAESREYPKRRWRRAWIVKDDGVAMHHNGIGFYVGWSDRCIGEVFFDKKDADLVAQEKRRIFVAINADPNDIRIQPVMVPRQEGPSEHARILRNHIITRLREGA